MQTGDVPRSEPTLRNARSGHDEVSGSAQAIAHAATSIAQDRVVRLLVGLTLAIGAAGTAGGWTPGVTMVAAVAAAVIALAALASTLTELRADEDGGSPWRRSAVPDEVDAPSSSAEAGSAPSGGGDRSWEEAASAPPAATAPVGTTDEPVAILVIKMNHPDERTIVALSRVPEWSPVELFPIRADRFDERAFVSKDRTLASSPHALIAHIAALSPGVLDNLRLGVALTPDDGGPDSARALAGQCADTAQHGAIRWRDTTSMRLFARGGLRLGELREALQHGEIVTRFQPLYDNRTWGVVGAELLVSWEHPELGPLSPGRFLPRFQTRPEFTALTQGVFETACRKVAGWEARAGRRFQVVVNAGVPDLCAPATFGVVAHLLHHVGTGHVWVDVEVDELLMADERQRAMLVAHGEVGLELLATGVRSPSQLEDLEGLPVVGVKIDMHQLSRKGWAEVNQLAHLARLRGYEVHAVRVGDPESVERVAAIDTISFVQGYALSAPVDEATMDRIAAARRGAHSDATSAPYGR